MADPLMKKVPRDPFAESDRPVMTPQSAMGGTEGGAGAGVVEGGAGATDRALLDALLKAIMSGGTGIGDEFAKQYGRVFEGVRGPSIPTEAERQMMLQQQGPPQTGQPYPYQFYPKQ